MRGSPTRSPRAVKAAERVAVLAVSALVLGLVVSSAACGTEPVGVEACKKIERTRCESAQACGIDLRRPLHTGTSEESNVAACIRYYDDQCLHGLVVTKEPSQQAVDACVDAIITGDCSVVKEPQTHEACKFLVPPAAPAPAADASDATTEAQADASAEGG